MKIPSVSGRLLGRVVLAVVAIVFAVYFINVAIRYREFRRELRGLGQVRLTDHRADVMYRLGEPTYVIGPFEQGYYGRTRRVLAVKGTAGDQNTMPRTTKVGDYPGCAYGDLNDKSHLVVDFDLSGQVETINVVNGIADPFAWGPVAGIWNGDSEEKILGLGAPSASTIDHATKTIEFSDIGVEFNLTKGKVYRVTLRHHKKGEWAVFWRFLHTLP